MKAAKLKFDGDEIANKNKLATPFTGFQTAKGKSVKISDDALKAAKQKIDSDDITNTCKATTPFTGFQTAKGKSIKISDSALKAAKQRFDSDEVANNNKLATQFTGFQTAKGKSVKISDDALKAAKQRLDSDELTNNSNRQSTTQFTQSDEITSVDTLEKSKPTCKTNEEYCLKKPTLPWINQEEVQSGKSVIKSVITFLLFLFCEG